MLLICVNIIILVASLSSATENSIVLTKSGLIRGKSHGHYYSFEGIPYAEPPIGNNRFEPPVPYLRSWSDIADATKLHESCIRLDATKLAYETKPDIVIGSEDCLYLNIYTPDIENYQLYPVMFYIHGGGFMFGSGDDLREHILMDHQNMILVTFNYRLGPLGFLSTGDEVISGNMGLKDQRLALKWVKENIRSFNGNPDQILISGFSAGGSSVELHLLQSGAENYANAAISFSGSAFCKSVIVEQPLTYTMKLAKLLKWEADENGIFSTKDLKKYLKDIPAEDIVSAVQHFFSLLYNPFRIFGPVIEQKTVEDGFLTDHPTELVKNGLISNIPWIVGMTAEDGGHMIADLFKPSEEGKNILKEFNKRSKELLPIMLFYGENMSENETKDYTEMLWKKYDFPEKFTENDYNKLVSCATDLLQRDDIYKSINLHAQYSVQPVYGYLYNNPPGNSEEKFGTRHGDDVYLILDDPQRNLTEFPFREDENEISRKFIKMIEKFARTRIPQFGDFYLEAAKPSSTKIAKITRKSIAMEDF